MFNTQSIYNQGLLKALDTHSQWELEYGVCAIPDQSAEELESEKTVDGYW